MVLVQVLVELFRFLGGRQFIPRVENRTASPVDLQDSLLSLASVTDCPSLRVAAQAALSAVLAGPVSVYTYLLEGDFLNCEDPQHNLQNEGSIQEAVAQQRRVICDGIPPAELHEDQRPSLAKPLPGQQKVVITPLIDQGEAIAVLLISCGETSDEKDKHLDLLEKHITVACKRVLTLKAKKSFMSPLINTSQNHLPAPLDNAGNRDLDQKVLQLCGSLYDLNAVTVQQKIIQYLEKEIKSVYCFLLVSEDSHQLLCQVIGDNVLQEEISLPLVTGHLGKAVKEKKYLTQQDLTTEDLQVLSGKLALQVETMLCVPVECRDTGKVAALLCSFNKEGASRYTEADEHIIQHCVRHTAPVLSSSLALQRERKLQKQCQALLQVAKNLFTHLDDVNTLLKEIIAEARSLSNAERCSVFLLDKANEELVAKVFDGGMVGENETELHIPANQGIAGHVATTGEILNIKDAYSHPLFYCAMDERTGFHTQNILCFPIKDVNGDIVGVAELVNKINGPWFNRFDEDLAMTFSIYCGISIAHSLLYQKVLEAQFRSTLSNEMMRYHMKLTDEEVEGLLSSGILPIQKIHPSFAEFSYIPRSLSDDNTATAVISMFEDMGFINTYKIEKNSLARFCLMVKRGYRDPPYHNWMHAFSVSHFCYLLCKNLNMGQYLEDIEMFALFVSCLCHDLDHRGTNNSFQIVSKSVLAHLYSSDGSVLERHHFAQAISILNSEGCNIFDNCSRKDYHRILDLMHDIILATDIAHHLRILGDLQKMTTDGYDSNKPQHHELLLCLLMSASDLSDQTKDWKTTRRVAELIYKEFFSQGDREKAMGNTPIDMMDRQKAYIPDLQIGFMEHIVMPIFKLLKDLFPGSAELHHSISSNHSRWIHISQKYRVQGLPSNDSLEFLDDEY
ncbi:cGMP-dependent 3',5'-cyclic phosphodiesterase-like isoform X2 [Alosa sapidissima]|uniref:cGMP-dependent 3',5'-cyclic phosphodiesterase-like isoform X2 n=1 Tax=Alosa sapidissima TaxID=34773 RepID=UPI001C0A2131|nr:cGMP-dependent 3',5'-cyclic phosphodiesterase-like isoform X2 [Alosa sapidissima]